MEDKKIFGIQLKKQITLILCLVLTFFVSCSRQPAYPEPSQIGPDAVIDISTLRPEIPEFFTYHYRNKNINFFVIKLNNNVLSYLDACADCYPKKLGYRFDNGYITCRACNVRYSVSEIEKGFGSCFPIQITGHLQNGKYLIPVSSLEKMADRF